MSPLGALARGVSASALGTVAIGGGRVSRNRSALPLMTADVESAAMEPNGPRVAADIGRGFGYLFIALGVAMFIVESGDADVSQAAGVSRPQR